MSEAIDIASNSKTACGVISRVRDQQVPGAVNCHAFREVEESRSSRAVVANAGARHRGDDVVCNLANAFIAGIGKIQRASVHRQPVRIAEFRGQRYSAVALKSHCARACRCVDQPSRQVHAANDSVVVVGVGNVEASHIVHRNPARDHHGLRRRYSVVIKPVVRTSDRGNHSCGVNLPDCIIVKVVQIDISSVVDRQIGHEINRRAQGWPIVAVVARPATTRDGGDDAVGVYLANDIVVAIRDVVIALRV